MPDPSPTTSRTDIYIPLAEKSVIQAILLDPDILPKVKLIIPDPIAFFSIFLQEAYRTILTLSETSQPIDIISIKNAGYHYPLEKISEVFDVGTGIFPIRRGWEHIASHARAVQESYLRREILKSAGDPEKMRDVLLLAEELTKRGEDRVFTTKDVGIQVFDSIYAPASPVLYPFATLNKATMGIHKGQMIIVAARPSVGKSAWLDNLAMCLVKQKKRVFFASAEMSAESISKRMISRMSKVNLFYETSLTVPQTDQVSRAVEIFGTYPLTFHEMFNVSQLESQIKANVGAIDVVLVDYLQLIDPKKRYKTMYERATFVSNELKELSRRFNIPFVVAAQFNRSIEDDQPSMSNLRESGSIEQDADVIISLWRKNTDLSDVHRTKIYMDLLKNRNGYTYANGSREYVLWFDKALFEFSEPIDTP